MAEYYLSPSGNDTTGSGTIGSPWFTLNKAWTVISAGDTIWMRGGTYGYGYQNLSNKSGTSGNTINIYAYPDEQPVLSPEAGHTSYDAIRLDTVNYIHLKGLDISGWDEPAPNSWFTSIKCQDINNCTFEELKVHDNAQGLEMHDNSDGNLFLNCDFYRNNNPLASSPWGGADGITIRDTLLGTTNTLRGCRMYNNSDDGVDLWGSEGLIIFENCWAFHNGTQPGDITLEAGDGSGFKLGGTANSETGAVRRRLINCIAFENPQWGINSNWYVNDAEVFNCTVVKNGYMNWKSWGGGITFYEPDGYAPLVYDATIYAKNNISYGNTNGNGDSANYNFEGTTTHVLNNSWQDGLTASDADFISVDGSGLDGARQSDGSLPDLDFMKLASGSDMIDAGVDVGLPYNGSAPDLGAFEHYGSYYVSPTGNDTTGSGTIGSPWFSLNKAWTVVQAGDTIWMRGGTYEYVEAQRLWNLSGASGNEIQIFNYPDETPIIVPDATYTESEFINYMIYFRNADYIHFKGIKIQDCTRLNSKGWYTLHGKDCNNCTYENVEISNSTLGLVIHGGTGNLILNSDFHHMASIGHPTDQWGGSDGIVIGQTITSDVNTVRGCRMWWCSDDGIDMWANVGKVIVENTWAFWNGLQPGTTLDAGDGNGFKLGGDNVGSGLKREITNCLAFENTAWGFNTNDYTGDVEMYNCVAYNNAYLGYNTFAGGIVMLETSGATYYIKNNISFDNGIEPDADIRDGGANTNNNSWQDGLIASTADFESVDTSLATSARKSDNSLPDLTFMRLVEGSDMIDAGVDVGLPFTGAAPDLGAYEQVEQSWSYPFDLFMIGDSTMSDYNVSLYPLTGWGMEFEKLFNTNVVVKNRAISGESSQSFYDDHWTSVVAELSANDMVFIQFGHNDNGDTIPATTYKDYLTNYVTEARAVGAIPIFVTSVERNYWTGGVIDNTLLGYPEAMAELAPTLNVPCIDAHTLSMALYNAGGESFVTNNYFMNLAGGGVWPNYPSGNTDNTHFQEVGAAAIADMVRTEILSVGTDPLLRLHAPLGVVTPPDPPNPGPTVSTGKSWKSIRYV